MAADGVRGETAGESILTRLIGDEAEIDLVISDADLGLGHAAAFEVGLTELQLPRGVFLHHDGTVRNRAGVDKSNVHRPTCGDGVDGFAMGETVEVHAVIRGVEDGDEGNFHRLGFVAELEEIGGGNTCEEFLFESWDFTASGVCVMPSGRWVCRRGRGLGNGESGQCQSGSEEDFVHAGMAIRACAVRFVESLVLKASFDRIRPNVIISIIMNFRSLSVHLPTLIALAHLAGFSVVVASEPTAEEQYWLELLNRARRDPQGELTRLTNYSTPTTFASQASNDPNIAASLATYGTNAETLASQWSSLSAAPPVAWSSGLGNTATSYSQLMVSSDRQSHTLDGNNEEDLDLRLVGSSGYGPNWLDLGENLYASAQSVLHGHAGFILDWGDENGEVTPGYGSGIQSPAEHRINSLYSTFKEVGIGVISSGIPGTNIDATGPIVVTQHFGSQFVQNGVNFSATSILTGVVYRDDLLHDDFYTPGEGMAGEVVDVYVNGALSPLFSGFTNTAGGYNIALAGLITGDQVRIEAPGSGLASQTFLITSSVEQYGAQPVTFYDNLYAGFQAAAPVPEPGSAMLLLLATVLPRRRARR